MYDFGEDDHFESFTQSSKRNIPRKDSLSSKLGDLRKLEPWANHCFDLTAFQETQRIKNDIRLKRGERCKPRTTRMTREQASARNKMSESPNPSYRTDTSLEKNIEEKIKWKLEFECMRMKKKKTTDLLKQRFYGHYRSHTINPSESLAKEHQNNDSFEIRSNNQTLNLSSLYKKLERFSRKQQISARLKTSIKVNIRRGMQKQQSYSEQNGATIIKYRKEGEKRVPMEASSFEFIENKSSLNTRSLVKADTGRKIPIGINKNQQKTLKPRQSWQIIKAGKNKKLSEALNKNRRASTLSAREDIPHGIKTCEIKILMSNQLERNKN